MEQVSSSLVFFFFSLVGGRRTNEWMDGWDGENRDWASLNIKNFGEVGNDGDGVGEWWRVGGREGGRERLRKPLCDGLKLSFIACQGCAQWAAELMLYGGEWRVGVRRDNKKK